ncbi:MAG: hypothetical protein R3E01_19070 [Pirellulaceae bacterium]|nr:hypothetical protein [Planctomycetales bacterium]
MKTLSAETRDGGEQVGVRLGIFLATVAGVFVLDRYLEATFWAEHHAHLALSQYRTAGAAFDWWQFIHPLMPCILVGTVFGAAATLFLPGYERRLERIWNAIR